MNAGNLIAGTDYVIVRELGRGSTAVTYLARHLRYGHMVAIKLVQPLAYVRRHTASRFVREARALARIRHPHVVELLESPSVGNGLRCLVMEFIDGDSLSDVLARCRPPLVSCIRWIIQALDGLQAAHDAHVLHRDLKPGNLIIRRNDSACKVIDFGFCKGDSLDVKYSTTEGVFVGTPHYASPEQTAQKRRLTPASDVYSMGVILYECLTGIQLFAHLSTRDILLGRKREAPPPLLGCGYLPGSERLEKIVVRALQERPEDRYPTAEEMAKALDAYLVDELHAESARPADFPSVEIAIGPKRTRRRSTIIAGAAVACACVAVGTAVHLVGRSTSTPQPITPMRGQVEAAATPVVSAVSQATEAPAHLAPRPAASASASDSGAMATPMASLAPPSRARKSQPAPSTSPQPVPSPLNLGVIR